MKITIFALQNSSSLVIQMASNFPTVTTSMPYLAFAFVFLRSYKCFLLLRTYAIAKTAPAS